MPTTPWLSPNTVGTHAGHQNVGYGDGVWYATPRIKAVDGASAYIGPDGTNLSNGQFTEWLRAEQFAPTIPADAIITGLEIRLYIRRSRGAAILNKLVLVDDGIFQVASTKQPSRTLSGSLELLTFGGERDKWGLSLDRALALKSTFGVRIQCKATAATTNIDVEYVQARYHYTVTQQITAAPTVDVDAQRAVTVLLGTVAVTASAAKDYDYNVVTSIVLGSVTITAPAGIDYDYLADPTFVGGSSWFLAQAADASVDYDAAIEPTVMLGTITLQPSYNCDYDYLNQPEVIYGSVSFTADACIDVDAQLAATASLAIRLTAPANVDYDVQSTGIVQITWSVLALHPDFIRNSQQTQIQAFPLLVTITHKDLPAPLRFTDAGTSVVSRGEAYLAIPITVSLPTSGRNERAEGSIVLPVQSRQVRGIFRTLTGKPATVTIEMVRGTDTDIVEETWVMRLAATETSENVVLALNDGDFEDRQFPPLIFDGRWRAVHD